MKRKSFEEWQADQRAKYPDWDRYVRSFDQQTGPKRKLPLLLDENVEAKLVEKLRAAHRFRVTQLPARTDDKTVWRRAKQKGQLLVTSDGSDFWNDRKFPVHLGPAILILRGRTANEKFFALVVALVQWRIEQVYRRAPHLVTAMKIKASGEGTQGKVWDGTSVVLVEN